MRIQAEMLTVCNITWENALCSMDIPKRGPPAWSFGRYRRAEGPGFYAWPHHTKRR